MNSKGDSMTVEVFETDRLAKRNVAVLFYAQAILGSQQSINIILGGLVQPHANRKKY